MNQNPVQPKSKLLTIVIATLAIILIVSLAAYYFISTSTTSQIASNISPTTAVVTPTTAPTITLPPASQVVFPVEAGFKHYKNEKLAYGFNYPESSKIKECADISCLSIE